MFLIYWLRKYAKIIKLNKEILPRAHLFKGFTYYIFEDLILSTFNWNLKKPKILGIEFEQY